jgi:uncharacterized lipoprotein YddW (UPF0748 family)
MASGRLRASGVRLRQEPSTRAPILGELQEGSTVTVLGTISGDAYEGRLGRSTEWCQVTTPLGTGYVGRLWLTLDEVHGDGPTPLPKTVRGVWIAHHAHGKHFDSAADLEVCLDRLHRHGYNCLFPAVFNQSFTAYPSAVMQRYGFPIQDPHYVQKRIDPLRTLIPLAQERGMVVLPWFEYGFAADANPSLGPILQHRPDWIARDRAGNTVVDGKLTWMNGFLPDVQEFMGELFAECVATYDVAGVLGDDRCPAMPWISGHDPYTLGQFRARHGNVPAEDGANSAWSVFRRELLTRFLGRLRQRVKAVKPGALLAISPAPLDWGREKNLQDSGQWLHQGLVDLLLPQLYVNDEAQFLQALRRNISQYPAGCLDKVVAGLHLQPNERLLQPQDLEAMVQTCRQNGLRGISIFHYGYLVSGHEQLVASLDRTLALADTPVA